MMAPEVLTSEDDVQVFDLADPRYAEAFEERTHYDEVAAAAIKGLEKSDAFMIVARVLGSVEARTSFPYPPTAWLDATYDCVAQWQSYSHLGALDGKVVLQVGGSGSHAVKFLLGGARRAWLSTPMLGEALVAKALAEAFGVGEGLECVVGIAEELPFESNSFDAVFAGGCLHHTVTEYAIPEIARVLRVRGRFAAFDPWRAPLYSLGTKVFGKREPDVFCRPLTRARVGPLTRAFDHPVVSLHGTLTRYPLIALATLGLDIPLMTAFRIMNADDRLCRLLPRLRNYGSSVALLAVK